MPITCYWCTIWHNFNLEVCLTEHIYACRRYHELHVSISMEMHKLNTWHWIKNTSIQDDSKSAVRNKESHSCVRKSFVLPIGPAKIEIRWNKMRFAHYNSSPLFSSLQHSASLYLFILPVFCADHCETTFLPSLNLVSLKSLDTQLLYAALEAGSC